MDIIKLYGAAGTGKTKELIDTMIDELNDGLPSSKLLYTTFTKQGVAEGVKRLSKATKIPQQNFPYFATIHALMYRYCGGREKMMSNDTMKKFTEALEHEGISSQEQQRIREMHGIINSQKNADFEALCRNHAVSIGKYHSWERFYKFFVDKTEKIMLSDLLSKCTPQQLNIDVAVIDEAQDLSYEQWKVLSVMCSKAKRLYIAGDPNQAIFGWAGADHKIFLDLPAERTVVLDVTHRCPAAVWRPVLYIHSKMPEALRAPIATKVTSTEGYFNCVDVQRGGNWIDIVRVLAATDERVFLLATANDALSLYENVLTAFGYYYAKSPKPDWHGEIFLDVCALWDCGIVQAQATLDPHIRRTYGDKGRFLSRFQKLLPEWDKQTVESLRQMSINKIAERLTATTPEQAYKIVQIVDRYNGYPPAKPNITLSTVHKIKGREADHVVYLMDEYAPARERVNWFDQLRHALVAISRAKKGCTVLYYDRLGVDDEEKAVTYEQLTQFVCGELPKVELTPYHHSNLSKEILARMEGL